MLQVYVHGQGNIVDVYLGHVDFLRGMKWSAQAAAASTTPGKHLREQTGTV